MSSCQCRKLPSGIHTMRMWSSHSGVWDFGCHSIREIDSHLSYMKCFMLCCLFLFIIAFLLLNPFWIFSTYLAEPFHICLLEADLLSQTLPLLTYQSFLGLPPPRQVLTWDNRWWASLKEGTMKGHSPPGCSLSLTEAIGRCSIRSHRYHLHMDCLYSVPECHPHLPCP